MDHIKPLGLVGLVVLSLFGHLTAGHGGRSSGRSCKFPAVYNFGDSNCDTGATSAALSEVPPPNGESFFGSPSGRVCDGRLVINFIAEELKLPYLSPNLDSLGTDLRHCANFATGGSSIRPGGYSPFYLGIQINQFLRFTSRTIALYTINSTHYWLQFKLGFETRKFGQLEKRAPSKGMLSWPVDFSRALYTFDVGQNDLAFGFKHTTEEQVIDSVPYILANLSHAMHQLYEEGGSFFWIHNTGLIGCLPYNVIYYHSKPGNLDKTGCAKTQNAVAQEFNRQLKDMVLKLRTEHPLAEFTYVDVYSAKYMMISQAKELGLFDPMEFCCGSYYGYHIDCGKKATVNGTVHGNPCKDPSRHISWDGIHYSLAANIWIAMHILNGSLSDPPVSIGEACHYPKNVLSQYTPWLFYLVTRILLARTGLIFCS